MSEVPIQSDSSLLTYAPASCHTEAMTSGRFHSKARLYAMFPAVQPYSRRISGAKSERLKLSSASGIIWLLNVQVVPTIVSNATEPEMRMDMPLESVYSVFCRPKFERQNFTAFAHFWKTVFS